MIDFRTTGKFGLRLFVVALVCFAQTAVAVEGKKARGEFGIKFGHLGSGTDEYQLKSGTSDKDSVKTQSSYSGGAFLSQSVWGGLHGAIAFDLHYLRGEFGGGETALDVAGGVKYILADKSKTLSVRPAVLVGFGILPDIWSFKSSQYVTLKMVVEVAFHTEKGTGLLIEVGSLRTISGADSRYDIKAKSMMLLRVGLIL
jgi:hypothetical protein